MTLLSPLGLLVALAMLAPLAAWAAGERRAARVRRTLGLAPQPARARRRPAATAAVGLLLALACAQPALTREQQRRVRSDAAALVVVDVSRSMQASATLGSATRLERARVLAVALRERLGDVPVGLASMTDRIVPLLFPSADADAFAETVRRALASESPPPRETDRVATSFDALGELASANLFLPGDRRRLVVLLTDGESRPFAEAEVARALRAARLELVTVRVGSRSERVFRADGRPEALYRPGEGAETLAGLAAATGGSTVAEDELGAAVAAARTALGSGPTRRVAAERTLVRLAPWLALLALVPLAAALAGPVRAKPLPRLRPRATIGAR